MNCNWRKCGWESFCDRGSNLLTSRIPERGTFDARRVCLKFPKIKLLYLMSLWPRRNATSYQPQSISAFTIAEKKLTKFRPRRDSKPCLPDTVGALLATELRSHTLITRQILYEEEFISLQVFITLSCATYLNTQKAHLIFGNPMF